MQLPEISPQLLINLTEISGTNPDKVDQILVSKDDSIEKSYDRLKQMLKYTTVLVNFIETRTKHLADYGKTLGRSSKEFSIADKSQPLSKMMEIFLIEDIEFSQKSSKLRDITTQHILTPMYAVKSETEKNMSIISKYWNNEQQALADKVKKYSKARKSYRIGNQNTKSFIDKIKISQYPSFVHVYVSCLPSCLAKTLG